MNGLDLQSQKIVNMGDPTSSSDAATKNYVDAAIRGIQWRPPVRAASAGSNVSTSSPGTTLDGVTLVTGDRILLMSQTTGSQNGLWVWNGSSSALTRPTDYAAGSTVSDALAVSVGAGTANADRLYMIYSSANANPEIAVVDTDATTWGALAGSGASYTAGNGLQLSSSQFSVLAADSTVNVTGSGISVNTSTLHNTFTEKYSTTLTSGSSSYTVNHALGTNVVIMVFDASGNTVIVDLQTASTSGGTTTVTFGATTAGNHTIVVVG
jgi:hypothetical protein